MQTEQNNNLQETKINYFSIKSNTDLEEKENIEIIKNKKKNISNSINIFTAVMMFSIMTMLLFDSSLLNVKNHLYINNLMNNYSSLNHKKELLNTTNIALYIKDIEKSEPNNIYNAKIIAANSIAINAITPFNNKLNGNILLYKNGVLVDNTEDMKLIKDFNKFDNPEKLAALNKISEKNLRDLISLHKKAQKEKEDKKNFFEDLTLKTINVVFPQAEMERIFNKQILNSFYKADNAIKHNKEIYDIVRTPDKSGKPFSVIDYIKNSDKYWDDNYKDTLGKNPDFLKINFNLKDATEKELKEFYDKF